MENQNFANESPKKGQFFIFTIIILAVFAVMGIGIDIDQFLQKATINIPTWYFYIIFSVDIIMLLALLFIFSYRKIGVVLYPIMVLSHFYFHMYYLDTFLYSDITNLFLFVGLGLLAIIPKWKFFK